MAHNLNIYSTDGRETSYGIYVNGTKQATVNLSWSITTTCTNGTYSGDNTINRGSGTATVTLSANSGYALPSSITVTNASYTYNQSTGVVSLSSPQGNVTITCVCEAVQQMPVKGDIITMNVDGTDRQYRVLKINNTVAEVLSMYAPTSIAFDSVGTNTYAGKTLDTYLNSTWYNTLTSTAKAAIVDKTFTQDSWSWDSAAPSYVGKYKSGNNEYTYNIKLSNAQYESAITRHVYALSVQDVLDYLGASTSDTSSNTKLTYTNIWQMLWNSSTSQSDWIWLSSARADYSSRAVDVLGYDGSVVSDRANYSNSVRPAFKIDLSKISWSKTA